jgi:hypothetical protein
VFWQNHSNDRLAASPPRAGSFFHDSRTHHRARNSSGFPFVLCGCLPRCKCNLMMWRVVGCSLLSCLLHIPQRIFCLDAGKPDDGRPIIEEVEKTVWRQIVGATRADGRDPADRARTNNRCQRVVAETMSLRRLIGVPIPAFDCTVRTHGRSADRSTGARRRK